MNRLINFIISIVFINLAVSCYGVNAETSELGSYNWTCLKKSDLLDLEKQYSVGKISDSIFLDGLQQVKSHFLTPDYILYFDESPREIVGFDGYSIRVAFNPDIAYDAVDGLSPQLSDKEQVRIRNRVLKLIWEKECEKGKRRIEMFMRQPAVFSKQYYEAR